MLLAVDAQIRPLGQVLAHQAIHVLVGASLPGAVRIAEVHGNPRLLTELLVHGQPTVLVFPSGRCPSSLKRKRKMQIDYVSQARYSQIMKAATIPPIRIESAFRQEIEQALGDGETMASLVESAVRTEVSRRRDQTEFVRRGLASIARSEAEGDWIPAETVLAKLEAKVAAARKRQGGLSK